MTRLKQWLAAAVVAGTGVSAQAAMTHTAATLDTRAMVLAGVLPDSCTYAMASDGTTLTVTFTASISSAGSYELPNDMGPIAFNVNGKTITGKAGTNGSSSTNGGAGSPVFKVGSGTTISISGSSGSITGGAGGWGKTGGAGAYAFVNKSSGTQFTVSGATSLVKQGAAGRSVIAVPTQSGTLTYNGSSQTVTLTGSGYTKGGTTSGTAAGSYTATATPDSTHCWSDGGTGAKNVSWSIGKKEVSLSWGTTTFTYNGSAQKPTCTAGNLVSGDSCTVTVSGEQTNAGGPYTATASGLSNSNYQLPAANTTTFTILKSTEKPFKQGAADPEGEDYTMPSDPNDWTSLTNKASYSEFDCVTDYDGAAHTIDTAALAAAYTTACVAAPTFAYSSNTNDASSWAAAPVELVDAGATGVWYRVSVPNYEDLVRVAKVVVVPREVTITFTAADKVFDGTAVATCTETNFENVVAGEGFTLDTSAMTFSFADGKVGADKTVTATGYSDDKVTALEGTEKSNYTFAFADTTTASITENRKMQAVTITQAVTVKPWDSAKGEITVDYSISGLGGLDAETTCKVAFDVTANGQTASITNEAAKLTDGPQQQKVIDTVALFGKEVVAKDAKVKISLIAVKAKDLPSDCSKEVQLWENGPIFDECNVGASSPEEPGYYFWWGDTVGYKRNGSSWDAVDGSKTGFSFEKGNCPTYDKTGEQLQSAGYIDSTGNLVVSDIAVQNRDAARAHLGAPWRMMTKAELECLSDTTKCKWTLVKNAEGKFKGYTVTGVTAGYTDKSIFLPAAGFGMGSDPSNLGSSGAAWSSTHDPDNSHQASCIHFNSSKFRVDNGYRYFGLPVRAVREAAAFVAGAGVSVNADDAAEEEVIATAETSFWLGPEGQPVGEGAWIVQTDAGCHIVGEGAATSVPEGFTRNTIKTATIDDGITEIGARFFKDFRRMSRVEGGKGLVRFGEKAFYRCLDLEEITIANSDFEVDCLNDAVVYQTAIDKDGKPYVVPSINIPGYENMLYGTDDLANPTWQPVNPGTKMEESGYHFFKFVLQKIKE